MPLFSSFCTTSHALSCSPALTSMNGSTTNALSPHYLHTAPQQSSRPSYQFQSTSHPALTIGSPYVPASPYYPSLQHQSQPQGTLSPQALHTPSTPSISSSAYPPPSSSAATTKTESSEVRVARFQAAIRPLLQPNAFTGAAAVNSLVSYIVDYGSSEVDAAIRIEILTKIRDNAGNHYFRAWADSLTAIELTREWLKAGFTAKGDATLVDTIMPLLQVSLRSSSTLPYLAICQHLRQIIDRLPLTIESLKNSKLGKIVVKLVKDPPAPGESNCCCLDVSRAFSAFIDNKDGLHPPHGMDLCTSVVLYFPMELVRDSRCLHYMYLTSLHLLPFLPLASRSMQQSDQRFRIESRT
jgi:protein phosphatase 1 regulatory subunit 10